MYRVRNGTSNAYIHRRYDTRTHTHVHTHTHTHTRIYTRIYTRTRKTHKTHRHTGTHARKFGSSSENPFLLQICYKETVFAAVVVF